MNREPTADSGYTNRKALCAGLGVVALGCILKNQDSEALQELGTGCIFIGGGFSLYNLVKIVTQR